MYERTYQKKVLSQTPPEESAAKKRRRRRRAKMRRILKVLFVLALITLVVFLIRLPQLQVRTVDVVGTSVVDPEDVSRYVQSQIEGNILYLLPKKSMLLVPTASIAKWTARQFPRFATVDVRRKGVHGLIVTVTEHTGTYLWCQEAQSQSADAAAPSCYFMTSDGLVFAPAPVFSGNAYVRIYMGAKQELPFTPLTPDQLSLVQLLLDRLPAVGITPNAFRAISEHEIEIDFSHYGSTAQLLIDPVQDASHTYDMMLQNIATALSTDPLKSDFANPSKNLEYLDARFANKVVYKFK